MAECGGVEVSMVVVVHGSDTQIRHKTENFSRENKGKRKEGGHGWNGTKMENLSLP